MQVPKFLLLSVAEPLSSATVICRDEGRNLNCYTIRLVVEDQDIILDMNPSGATAATGSLKY